MKRIDVSARKLGVVINAKKSFARVWAPEAKEVSLVADGQTISLHKEDLGYWSAGIDCPAGTKYQFQLNGKELLPDPASLAQPEGVHGPSEAVDTSFAWTDAHWQNPKLDDYIFYELHAGTFTNSGTFKGIEEELDYLVDLGITAIELMPIAQFPGARNWGYDGVFPFAAQNSYGGAKALQHLVNRCHEKGLAVVLDVVYNHFGPEGNRFRDYGPYFTEKYKTPWGDAINFDDAGSDQVRDFFFENAMMWFRDFHIDALRLDAVHAIRDFGASHFLQELRAYTDELSKHTGRQYHLIVECDLNDNKYLRGPEEHGYGMHAQWNDEFHHALRVSAGMARDGYYTDFNGLEHLAKAYRDAYVYDGIYSPHRNRTFGNSAEGFDGNRFVVFSQNHDQIGNRMLGERTGALNSFEMLKVLAAAVIFSPFLPMLFMGEEWGAKNPFQYFISHEDADLVEAVRQGRKKEFSGFFNGDECPDPQADETFHSCKLDRRAQQASENIALAEYYKHIISLRKKLAALKQTKRDGVTAEIDKQTQVLILGRSAAEQRSLCLFNFSKQQQSVNLDLPTDMQLILNSADDCWKGTGSTAQDKSNIIMQPESVILFSNEHI